MDIGSSGAWVGPTLGSQVVFEGFAGENREADAFLVGSLPGRGVQ
jgi:hypothetical protein